MTTPVPPTEDEDSSPDLETLPPPPRFAGDSDIGTVLPISDDPENPDDSYYQPSDTIDVPRFDASVLTQRRTPKRLRPGVLAVAGITIGLLGVVVLIIQERSAPPETLPVPSTVSASTEASPPIVAAPSSPCPSDMVFVPAGKFFMGTHDEHPIFATARPPTQRTVSGFCIDRHEVSVGDYRGCSDLGNCLRAHRDSTYPQASLSRSEWTSQREKRSVLCNEANDAQVAHPVNCVSWAQASHYCATVGKRLPSEEEWEFAARGSDGRVYSWGDQPPSPRHMNGCGPECTAWKAEQGLSGTNTLYSRSDQYPGTAPVGSFPEGISQHGAMDMAGNVFEWTATAFVSRNKKGPKQYVIRGGAFNSTMPQFADPALRFGQVATAHPDAVGFRCAMTPAANIL